MWFSAFPLPIPHKHARVTARRACPKHLTEDLRLSSAATYRNMSELPVAIPAHLTSLSFQFKSCLHFWTCFFTARSVVERSCDRERSHSDLMANMTRSLLQWIIISTRWSFYTCLGNFTLFYPSMGILWVHILQSSFSFHKGIIVQNPTLQLCSVNSVFSQPTSYPFSPRQSIQKYC